MLQGMDWEVESLSERDNPFLYYSQESCKSISLAQPSQELEEPEIPKQLEKLTDFKEPQRLLKEPEELKKESKPLESRTEKDGESLEQESREIVNLEFVDNQDSRFDIYQLPFLIKTYISSISSILLFLFALYLISTLFWTIRNDLSVKSHEMYLELMQEIKDCTNNYQINACHLDLPAIKELCLEWKSCMSKPLEVKRLKITLGYIIEVLNSSLDSFSLRTIALMALISVLRLF